MVLGVVVGVVMTSFTILETINLRKFLYLSSSSLYKTLKKVYKEVYGPNERIIIQHPGPIPHKLLAHLTNVITALDIPDFVIQIDTNINDETDYPIPETLPLLDLPDTLCPYPWINLEIQSQGTVRPCCVINESLSDAGKPVNFNTSPDLTLSELYFNDFMVNLRDQFRKGQKPKSCSKCWFEESQGKVSDRQNYIIEVQEFIHEIDFESENISNLKSLDIKLGNICNLACRICRPESSSSLATEVLETVDIQDIKTHPVYLINQQSQWIRKPNSFWAELKQHLPNIKFLIIAGGEPMMIPEHLDLLEAAKTSGRSKEISLRYNTNGTIYSDAAVTLWESFKHVRIVVSIDDLTDRFEYQRSNASWHTIVENLNKYKKNSSADIVICCTVNIQNVLYLPEIYSWCIDNRVDNVYLNLLHQPTQLSIEYLTPGAKRIVLEKLSKHDFGKLQDKINPIISIIENSDPSDANSTLFSQYMESLDQSRGQYFGDSHPEMAKAMNYVKTNISN